MNWSTKIAAGAGAALLASFATFATPPKTASAATLSKNEESGEWESSNANEAVDKILNLDIGGKLYDVTLSDMNFEDIQQDYLSGVGSSLVGVDSVLAANAIMEALGDTFWTSSEEGGFRGLLVYDGFMVVSELEGDRHVYYGDKNGGSFLNRDKVDAWEDFNFRGLRLPKPVAQFHGREEAAGGVRSPQLPNPL